MLYDKQEGSFKELDTRRYAIVDLNYHSGLVYINHYRDGTMYTGASPFINSECSCVEVFDKNGTAMKRLGIINTNSGYIILYSTKKVSKLKKAFESIAKYRHIDNIEVVRDGCSAIEFNDIDSVARYIQSISTKIPTNSGYIYIHLFSGGYRVSEACLYIDCYQEIKFQTFKTSISFDNKHINGLFNICSKFEGG